MGLTRLQIAKKDILNHFESQERKILKHSDIEEIIAENGSFWRMAQSTTTQEFIRFLAQYGKLQEHRFNFPNRNEVRYAWGEASDFEIIQSLRPDSYFSHFSAIYFNKLTSQIPKTIYLNFEQAKKIARIEGLTQNRIDYAFRRPCRASKTISKFADKRICILNGKHTGQMGVVEFSEHKDHHLRITNIERTLIDIVVRPIYSGGVQTVLEAYRRAANNVSINKLAALLSSLDYIYPYHQAIGFYLERSNVFSESRISLIDRFEKKHDFYLTHQIKDSEYSKRWKLYYPKGL